MSKFTLRCPACQFTNDVEIHKIPTSAKRVTCPKCQHIFTFDPPTPQKVGQPESQKAQSVTDETIISLTGRSHTKANKLCLTIFLILVLAAVGLRLWAESQALNMPRPTLLAASEDGVAVVGGTSIYLFDTDGTSLGSYPFADKIWPTQLYWDRGELCLADLESKTTLTFGNGASGIRSFSGTTLDSHFKVVRQPQTGQLFVTDSHRVAVFDENGDYLRTFGKKGIRGGEFKFPNGLVFDEAGQLLIANTKRPSVDLYAPDGRFLQTLITPTGDKTYRYPTHVLIINEQLVTLERDGYLELGKVRIYDRSGTSLGELPLGSINSIGDLSTDGDRLYLTDREDRQLLVFSLPDLLPLGSLSSEFEQMCSHWGKEEAFYKKVSLWALVALFVLCAPVIYFYIRIKRAEVQKVSKVDLNQVIGSTVVSGSEQKVNNLILSSPVKKLQLRVGLILLGTGVLGVLLSLLFAKMNMPSTYLLVAIAIAMPSFVVGVIFLMLSGGIAGWKRKQTETLFKRIISEGKLSLQSGEQVERVALTQKSASAQDIVILVFTSNRFLSYSFNWNRVAKIEQFPYQAIQQVQDTSGRFLEVMRSIEVTIKLAGETKKLKYFNPTSAFLRQLENEFVSHIGRESRVHHALLCLSCMQPMQGDLCMTCATRLTPDRRAMWLSLLFPGLGQLRNGEMQKGLVFLIGTVILLMIGYIGVRGWFYEGADLSLKEKFNFAVLIAMAPFLYVANIMDAYRVSIRGRKLHSNRE